uniref:FHA domain-containing protein n=1 Tax=Anopheles epiroticus TaxID=199890 RepID=A0A182PV95_9DIPT
MTEKADFKVPTVDPKVLSKLRKSVLPASASKADIEAPSAEAESSIADTFEQNNVEIPPIPYKEPAWSRKCDASLEYSFEVEKNGVIVDEIKQLQSKPFWLFGRLPNCDINMAHPTISRYHAIFQYRAPDKAEQDDDDATHRTHTTIASGWYLFDLNSTHGTFLNKQQIPARTYVRVRVGYMIKLGSSSRTYIFQGPSDDQEPALGLTITEMREHINKQKQLRKDIKEIAKKEKERIEKLKEEQQGISWGMAEDADEETDLTENPYATSNNEELFLDDPKKTLRGYFEREGHELEYKVEELSSGTYCCKVELPIDDSNGRPIVAEVTHKGKKKEVVVQCALEACRILDRHGLLRQANHEPRRRHQKQSDSDDDDDFLDRTGAVEKRRKRKEAAKNPQTHTYADLIHKEAQILELLESNESKIQNARLIKQETHLPENAEDVDSFLENLTKDKVIDKFEIRRLRMEQVKLTQDLAQVKKLIQITKPVDIDKIGTVKLTSSADKRPMLPLFGKRNKLSNTFGIRKSTITAEKDVDAKDEAESSATEKQESTSFNTDTEISNGSASTHTGKVGETSNYKKERKRASLVVPTDDDACKAEAPAESTASESSSSSSSKKKRLRQRSMTLPPQPVATEPYKVVPIHQHRELMDQCIALINSEWPRSYTARLWSLESSKETLPTSFVLTTKNGKDETTVLAHAKLSPIPADPAAVFVESVVVTRERRGQGIGRLLMQEVEKHCFHKLHLKTIYLSTIDQEAFYAKLGYKLCRAINIFGSRPTLNKSTKKIWMSKSANN